MHFRIVSSNKTLGAEVTNIAALVRVSPQVILQVEFPGKLLWAHMALENVWKLRHVELEVLDGWLVGPCWYNVFGGVSAARRSSP